MDESEQTDKKNDAVFLQSNSEQVANFKFAKEVLELFYDKQKDKATERMVNKLKQQYKFKTVEAEEDSETYVYENGFYQKKSFVIIDKFVRDVLGKAYKGSIVKEIESKIKADTYIPESEFQQQTSQLVNVKNCIVDIGNRVVWEEKKGEYFPQRIEHSPVIYFKAQDRTAERIEVGMTLNNAVNIIIATKKFDNDALLKAMNLVWNTLQEFKQTTEKPVVYEPINEEIQVEVEQNKEEEIPF